MDLDPVFLSRIQFAFLISFHIIFPYVSNGSIAPSSGCFHEGAVKSLFGHFRSFGRGTEICLNRTFEPRLGSRSSASAGHGADALHLRSTRLTTCGGRCAAGGRCRHESFTETATWPTCSHGLAGARGASMIATDRVRTVVRFRERQIRECATVRQLRWGGAEGKFYRETIASPRSQRAFNFGARPQRLLLASTGTKDPRASDILYINGLAAPNTVNTMPEGTSKALAEHGEVGAPMPPDGGDSDAVLAQFGKAGIDIDALAARLQEEGAASFVKSWHELMGVMASKSAALEKAS